MTLVTIERKALPLGFGASHDIVAKSSGSDALGASHNTGSSHQVDPTPAGAKAGPLLLVLPALVRRGKGGELFVEAQAHNGLQRWADSFSRVDAVCEAPPLQPDEAERYLPMADLLATGRIRWIELPTVPSAISGAVLGPAQRRAREVLHHSLQAAAYVCIVLGHFREDWSHLAAHVARRAGRAYAVWADRVEHRVVLAEHRDRTGWRRAYRWARARWFLAPALKMLDQQAVEGAALGLFHGQDSFEAYSACVREAHLVHDIHLRSDDQVSDAHFEAKRQAAQTGPLRIVYVGRAAAMKGPQDWLRTMKRLRGAGVRFSATWIGDGPLLEALRSDTAAQGLSDHVNLPGYLSERSTVLQALREAHLFVFCHGTPESPRNLIEALMSGTPTVGYESAYAHDLLQADARDWLVAHHPDALAQRVAHIVREPALLDAMLVRARTHGRRFCDSAVFAHRSELIQRVLPAHPAPADTATLD